MYIPNCKIDLSGLTVSDLDRIAIEKLMNGLVGKSPSDSYLKLCILNGENKVNGFLSITSKSRKFESSQYGENPLNVVKKLSKDLQSQIKIWAAQREF